MMIFSWHFECPISEHNLYLFQLINGCPAINRALKFAVPANNGREKRKDEGEKRKEKREKRKLRKIVLISHEIVTFYYY